MKTLAKNWIAKSLANDGLLLKVGNEASCSGSCNRGELSFDNAAASASLRPYFQVRYYPAAPASSKLASPIEGTTTARRLKLKTAWSVETAGVSGVTYQY